MYEPTEGLPFPEDTKWRWRWCTLGPRHRVLHRIVSYQAYGYGDGRAYAFEVNGELITIPQHDESEDTCVEGCDRWIAHIHGGVTACGLIPTGNQVFQMPGLFARMSLPRCKHCCRKLGIATGNGAPFNHIDDARFIHERKAKD